MVKILHTLLLLFHLVGWLEKRKEGSIHWTDNMALFTKGTVTMESLLRILIPDPSYRIKLFTLEWTGMRWSNVCNHHTHMRLISCVHQIKGNQNLEKLFKFLHFQLNSIRQKRRIVILSQIIDEVNTRMNEYLGKWEIKSKCGWVFTQWRWIDGFIVFLRKEKLVIFTKSCPCQSESQLQRVSQRMRIFENVVFTQSQLKKSHKGWTRDRQFKMSLYRFQCSETGKVINTKLVRKL